MAKTPPDKRCGAQRPNQPPGVTCTLPQGWGTGHPGIGRCKRHGGSTPNHERAARLSLVRTECAKLAIPIETDPVDAMLSELYRTCGWVHAYEAYVQSLDLVDGEHWGRLYGPSGFPTGEAKPHVSVELLFRERRHLADVAAAAIRANIDERRVRLVEDQAAMVHRAFEAALEAAQLTLEQRQEARQAYGRHLRAA